QAGVYRQLEKSRQESVADQLCPEDMLVQKGMPAIPDMRPKGRTGRPGPADEEVAVLDVELLRDRCIAEVERGVPVVEVLDADDWQATLAPLAWLEGSSVHQFESISESHQRPPWRHSKGKDRKSVV